MPNYDLDQAINDIRETVAEWSENQKHRGPGYGPRALIILAVYEVELCENADRVNYWCYDRFYAESFADSAKHHWDVHRLYADVIASKLKAGAWLFEDERNFAAAVLSGEASAPRKPKANKLEDKFSRNLLILSCINFLVEDYGLNRFRNDAKKSKSPDAPSIVSEAFELAGHHDVTPSTIKGVLQNKQLAPWLEKLNKARTGGSLKARVLAAEYKAATNSSASLYAKFGGLSRQ